MKPALEEIRAFQAARHSRIYDYLKNELEETRDLLETQTLEALPRLQGRAALLKQLVKLIES